jgi:hypothetical protein
MKSRVSKGSSIGNSRGIRLLAKIPRKVHIIETVATEKNLSWEETAKAMAAAREDWSDWDATTCDGIHGCNAGADWCRKIGPDPYFPKLVIR